MPNDDTLTEVPDKLENNDLIQMQQFDDKKKDVSEK